MGNQKVEELLESNVTGKVKWFNKKVTDKEGKAERNYGWITRADGKDEVFVHGTGVTKESYPLIAGRSVVFDIVNGSRGQKASNVVMVQSG